MTEQHRETYSNWAIYGSGTTYAVEDAVRSYNVSKDYRHGERAVAQACLTGLIYLLENTGNCPGINSDLRKLNYNASVNQVREAFEQYEGETLEEHKEMLEDDPEWAERYGSDHPWGEEEVVIMKAWLALDPFEWFLFRRSVKQAGTDALEERLDEYMTDECPEYRDIAEAVFKATETLMGRFSERVGEAAE